jgi:hypothetical protein
MFLAHLTTANVPNLEMIQAAVFNIDDSISAITQATNDDKIESDIHHTDSIETSAITMETIRTEREYREHRIYKCTVRQ